MSGRMLRLGAHRVSDYGEGAMNTSTSSEDPTPVISVAGLTLGATAAQQRRPRRILFVTHVGDAGGGELKMLDLCRAEHGNAEVLLFQHGSLETTLRSAGVPFSVLPLPAAARGVRKEDGAWSLLNAIPGTLSMVRGLVATARQFDVVICFSQKAFVVASLAKPFMRRPLVWFMNDILSPEHFSAALIRIMVNLSRFTADRIVLNSQASWRAWRQAGGRERGVSVIYPGVETQPIANRDATHPVSSYRERYAPGGRPLIGMFGRLSRWKGQAVLLEALEELPDVNAIMVGGCLFGEEEYERGLRARIRELDLEARVTLVGHVEQPMPLMAACDIVVHCSTAPEPFGLVIAEAMLAGTPVIASDAGGAQEIVLAGQTGQLTPPGDARALAAAIRRYLDRPAWAQELAQRGKARAQEKFSVATMTDEFRRLTETL